MSIGISKRSDKYVSDKEEFGRRNYEGNNDLVIIGTHCE
jgi:hypothetical protein